MTDPASAAEQLTTLAAGMVIPFGGDRVTVVSRELADAFEPGDRLVVLQDTGTILHVPRAAHAVATAAVDRAVEGFSGLANVSDEQITSFYEAFAAALEDDATFAPIAAANEADVASARDRGRSTTRLVLSDGMRTGMVAGLRTWRDAPSGRDRVVGRVEHDGWSLEEVSSGLGVIAFIFEGRPNVFADATGVLRSGNSVVFRIGSDALGTARAIVEHALEPALASAGLPSGAVVLVDAASHAAGHALFSDARLGLAVARGSGAAVAQLGAIARQAGIPVSLHGTGGAWIVAAADASPARLGSVVQHSLDRKVCNTLNTCCIPMSRADELVPVVLDALDRAAADRGTNAKLHMTWEAAPFVPPPWMDEVEIDRAEGVVNEPKAEVISHHELGHEWEWEGSPEMTLHVVNDVAHAVRLFNEQAPRFVASLVSEDPAEHNGFFRTIDAPFVGDGFTRWVDGQYALDKPELGLSNWQAGRLFARAGILSGDGVHTIRLRVTQTDPEVHR